MRMVSDDAMEAQARGPVLVSWYKLVRRVNISSLWPEDPSLLWAAQRARGQSTATTTDTSTSGSRTSTCDGRKAARCTYMTQPRAHPPRSTRQSSCPKLTLTRCQVSGAHFEWMHLFVVWLICYVNEDPLPPIHLPPPPQLIYYVNEDTNPPPPHPLLCHLSQAFSVSVKKEACVLGEALLCVCDSESLSPGWIILCNIVNLKRNCLRGQAFCVCQTKISKVKPFVWECVCVCVCGCKTERGRLYLLSGACCVSLQVIGSLSSLACDGPRLPREKERFTPSCTLARSTKRRGNESRRGRLTTVLMRWCVKPVACSKPHG